MGLFTKWRKAKNDRKAKRQEEKTLRVKLKQEGRTSRQNSRQNTRQTMASNGIDPNSAWRDVANTGLGTIGGIIGGINHNRGKQIDNTDPDPKPKSSPTDNPLFLALGIGAILLLSNK